MVNSRWLNTDGQNDFELEQEVTANRNKLAKCFDTVILDNLNLTLSNEASGHTETVGLPSGSSGTFTAHNSVSTAGREITFGLSTGGSQSAYMYPSNWEVDIGNSIKTIVLDGTNIRAKRHDDSLTGSIAWANPTDVSNLQSDLSNVETDLQTLESEVDSKALKSLEMKNGVLKGKRMNGDFTGNIDVVLTSTLDAENASLNYIKSSDLTTALSSYYDQSTSDTRYVNTSDLSTDVADLGYQTLTQIQGLGFSTSSDVTSSLTNYYTKNETDNLRDNHYPHYSYMNTVDADSYYVWNHSPSFTVGQERITTFEFAHEATYSATPNVFIGNAETTGNNNNFTIGSINPTTNGARYRCTVNLNGVQVNLDSTDADGMRYGRRNVVRLIIDGQNYRGWTYQWIINNNVERKQELPDFTSQTVYSLNLNTSYGSNAANNPNNTLYFLKIWLSAIPYHDDDYYSMDETDDRILQSNHIPNEILKSNTHVGAAGTFTVTASDMNTVFSPYVVYTNSNRLTWNPRDVDGTGTVIDSFNTDSGDGIHFNYDGNSTFIYAPAFPSGVDGAYIILEIPEAKAIDSFTIRGHEGYSTPSKFQIWGYTGSSWQGLGAFTQDVATHEKGTTIKLDPHYWHDNTMQSASSKGFNFLHTKFALVITQIKDLGTRRAGLRYLSFTEIPAVLTRNMDTVGFHPRPIFPIMARGQYVKTASSPTFTNGTISPNSAGEGPWNISGCTHQAVTYGTQFPTSFWANGPSCHIVPIYIEFERSIAGNYQVSLTMNDSGGSAAVASSSSNLYALELVSQGSFGFTVRAFVATDSATNYQAFSFQFILVQ